MANDEIELRIAWEVAVGSSTPARRLFDAVVARHREPHRRYHGVRHVVWVVRHAHTLAADLVDTSVSVEAAWCHRRVPTCDLGAITVAAFFHDAVYQPTAGDNEAASARLAHRQLTQLADPAWPSTRVDHVAHMVRATAGHLEPGPPALDTSELDTSEFDTAVLLDADLAVLGADPAAYTAYRHGVRAEYAHVDDAGWRAGRRAVLEGFLARASIYVTVGGRRRWEAAARANLVAELASLEPSS